MINYGRYTVYLISQQQCRINKLYTKYIDVLRGLDCVQECADHVYLFVYHASGHMSQSHWGLGAAYLPQEYWGQMPQNTHFKNRFPHGSASLLQVDHAVCEAGRLISTKNMKSLNVTPATVCINNLYKAGILFVVYCKTARRREEDVVPAQRPTIPHVLQCLVLFWPKEKWVFSG